MKIIYDSAVMRPEDALKKRTKALAVWSLFQFGLAISYTINCFELYYFQIKLVQPNQYLSLSNRIMTLVTELPINIAMIYFFMEFIKLKKKQRQLRFYEITVIVFILITLAIEALDTLMFNMYLIVNFKTINLNS